MRKGRSIILIHVYGRGKKPYRYNKTRFNGIQLIRDLCSLFYDVRVKDGSAPARGSVRFVCRLCSRNYRLQCSVTLLSECTAKGIHQRCKKYYTNVKLFSRSIFQIKKRRNISNLKPYCGQEIRP